MQSSPKKSPPNSLQIKEFLTDQFEDRPEGIKIDTLIVHSMYNPDADDIFSVTACHSLLRSRGVSVHYVIDREGTIWRLVSEEKKAWHAGTGKSRMPDPADGRDGINEFSVGIELIANEDSGFTDMQYDSLVNLSVDILGRHPIENIYGHSDIAPGRKTDPWNFDWCRYQEAIVQQCSDRKLKFPESAGG